MKTFRILAGATLMLAAGLSTANMFASSSASKPILKRHVPEAREASESVIPLPEVQATDNTSSSNQRIQLALLLDTSNSMDGLIDQAKAQLWNIVNELAKAKRDSTHADVEIALYEYGNDGLSVTGGYIRKVVPFTTDLDEISEKLFALTTNGGSEFCGKVMQTSLNELGWTESDSAFKVIYIAGNEAFTQGPVNFQTACVKAKEMNVVINTIYCGGFQDGISLQWQAGASCGHGTYLNIDSDKKAIQVATPYDAQIMQLNTQLNNTYVYYGSQGAASKEKQIVQDQNADKYSSANSAKRAVSKSSTMYKNTHWDLVDAYEKDKEVVLKVDKTTLPDSLKQKSNAEIEATIKAKTQERTVIKTQIAELGTKREDFIKATVVTDSSNHNTLGVTVVKTIRSQASSKGFVFE